MPHHGAAPSCSLQLRMLHLSTSNILQVGWRSMLLSGADRRCQQIAGGHLPRWHACSRQHRCCALAHAAQHRHWHSRLNAHAERPCALSRTRHKRLGVLALAPGMCFDAECQAAMDRAFLTATAVPLLGLASAIAYRLRPAQWQKRDGKQARMHPANDTAPLRQSNLQSGGACNGGSARTHLTWIRKKNTSRNVSMHGQAVTAKKSIIFSVKVFEGTSTGVVPCLFHAWTRCDKTNLPVSSS